MIGFGIEMNCIKRWSTPMWTLAKKYGISDVGLAKVCRKLTIPLPGRGYWEGSKRGRGLPRPSSPSTGKGQGVAPQTISAEGTAGDGGIGD